MKFFLSMMMVFFVHLTNGLFGTQAVDLSKSNKLDVLQPKEGSCYAIIPAKKQSQRCPNKNSRLINGIPVYQYSVMYAQQEGVVPIVSTDDEEKMRWCKENNVLFFEEVVDDSKMENCVNQVLEKYKCNSFVVLQPTSPIRRKGLLKKIVKENPDSAFTAQKIKMVGMLNGKFIVAHRAQDCKNFFYHFDGNICYCRTDFYKKSGYFFDKNSKIYEEEMPYNLQIDSEDDFKVIKKLLSR